MEFGLVRVPIDGEHGIPFVGAKDGLKALEGIAHARFITISHPDYGTFRFQGDRRRESGALNLALLEAWMRQITEF